MKPDEFREVMELERGLKPGDKVMAHWTNSGGCYSAPAVVERVNEKSIRVKLEEAVPGGRQGLDAYPAGREIVVPRIMAMERWSWNNRIGKRTLLKVICAWCGADLGEKDGKGVSGVSHGICPECAKKEQPKGGSDASQAGN